MVVWWIDLYSGFGMGTWWFVFGLVVVWLRFACGLVDLSCWVGLCAFGVVDYCCVGFVWIIDWMVWF